LISWIGYNPQSILLICLVILLLLSVGLHWEALAAGLAALASGSLNVLIKLLIQRPRPAAEIVDVFRHLTDFSFPSGHVMLYTGFFGFLWFLGYTLIKPSWKRTLLLLVFGGLVVLVGPSRIYLGQHWASDVLAGYLLSSLVLAVVIPFYRWGKPRFFVSQSATSEVEPGKEDRP
jgi:undecaprenyl-diphosphatase